MPPPMRVGVRMVAMMKALVRMRSRYSRFAMSQMLCINFAPVIHLPVLCCHFFNEYVFEGGLHDFEASDTGPGDGGGEQGLWIGSIAQLDFGAATVVFCRLDGGGFEERGTPARVVRD